MKTVKISLNSIDKVKSFVNDITKFDYDFDLVSGRYVIDAKSIMGIFSLDLSKPINLNIHAEESEIDNYLMGEFFDNLPIQTRCLIQDSEIEILDERCLNQIDDSVITIVRKVFLLSFTELGYKKNGHVGVEGVPLLYFKDNKNRFATTNNGKFTVSWWLRSADSTYDSCVYAVGPEGEIGSTNACDMNGIRPAFCVDGKQEIYKEEGRYILK